MDVSWKKMFLNWRVLLLLTFIFFSLLAIQPRLFGVEGATIRHVAPDSAAFGAGLRSPSPSETPLAKEKIIYLNGEKIV